MSFNLSALFGNPAGDFTKIEKELEEFITEGKDAFQKLKSALPKIEAACDVLSKELTGLSTVVPQLQGVAALLASADALIHELAKQSDVPLPPHPEPAKPQPPKPA